MLGVYTHMKNRTLYSSENIIFWPQYSAGKIGIVFVFATALIFFFTYLWNLFDNMSWPTPWYSLLFPLVVILVSFLISKSIRGIMHRKIVISHLGIEISNAVTNKNEKYLWSDIASIGFHRDGWYGREKLLVWLKDSPHKRPTSEPLYDLMISVDMLDKDKLLAFIPRDLYRNDPRMAWL